MLSRQIFANQKKIITSTVLKLCDVTGDITCSDLKNI